jgi:hypothetical protein
MREKSKNYEKNKKEKAIQIENERLVDKLLDRVKSSSIKEEYYRDENDVFMLRKSRSKKKLEKSNSKEALNKSQEKSRTKKTSFKKRNKSLLGDILIGRREHKFDDSVEKTTDERKRNYSTLLPTIEKIYSKNEESATQ